VLSEAFQQVVRASTGRFPAVAFFHAPGRGRKATGYIIMRIEDFAAYSSGLRGLNKVEVMTDGGADPDARGN
jgi:hypothetical protein